MKILMFGMIVIWLSSAAPLLAVESVPDDVALSQPMNIPPVAVKATGDKGQRVSSDDMNIYVAHVYHDGSKDFWSLVGMLLLIGGLYWFINYSLNPQLLRGKENNHAHRICPRCRGDYLKRNNQDYC